MRDIKNKKTILNTKVPLNNKEGFVLNIPQVNTSSVKYHNYFAGGMLGVMIGIYVGSMVGISIFAIQEKNYSFKTEELKSSQSVNQLDQNKDVLTLSSLDLNQDHTVHLYVSKDTMTAMSSR